MEKHHYYYCAAFIDGEGSVCLTNERKGARFRTPSVSVSSTTLSILEYLQRNFGGTIVEEKRRKPNHKDAWKWQIKRKNALDFLSLVSQYMREPEKKRRARLLLRNKKYYSKLGKRSDKEVEVMKLIEEEFFINKDVFG